MRVSHYRIFNISNRYSPCIPREMFASTLINPEETIFCDLPTLLVPLPAQRVHNSNLADHNSRGARASESGAHSLAMMHLVKNVMLSRLHASRHLSQWHLREPRMSSHASAARLSSKPQWNCPSATCCKDSTTPPDCRHPSDPRATSSALIRVGGGSPAGSTMPDG